MKPGVGTVVAGAIAFLGWAAGAEAQYSGAIRGVVYDTSGKAAPGAVVTISRPTEPIVRVAVTDLGGGYVVTGLEPGVTYVVHITHPQFRKRALEARAFAADRPGDAVLLKPRRNATAVRD